MPNNDHQPAGGAERPTAQPPIVPADLQKGDTVTIEGVFQFLGGPNKDIAYIDVAAAGYRVVAPVKVIATHTPKPRPLAPGDRVKFRDSAAVFRGPILAIHGACAWVDWEGDGSPSTEHLDDLERAQ